MNNRPLGCLALLPYRFTEFYFRAFYTFIKKLKKVIRAIIGLVTWISQLIEKFVDKIDKQLKILWLSILSTNLTCRLTIIDKFWVLLTYRLRFDDRLWSTCYVLLSLSCDRLLANYYVLLLVTLPNVNSTNWKVPCMQSHFDLSSIGN